MLLSDLAATGYDVKFGPFGSCVQPERDTGCRRWSARTKRPFCVLAGERQSIHNGSIVFLLPSSSGFAESTAYLPKLLGGRGVLWVRSSFFFLDIPMQSNHISLLDDLIEVDGRPMTTSRKVAARFGKTPSVVNRTIKAILQTEPDACNFAPVEYRDAKGEMRTEYRISKDGFCLLAMGFTGAGALDWKRMYIKAFNAMSAEIAKAAHIPSVTGTLYQQALTVEKAEALSFQAASDAAKIMRARRDVKPMLVQQLEMMREAVQLCLVLGLKELPEIA